MANTNVKKEGYTLKQTGEQIQAILDALEILSTSELRELLELLQQIDDGDGIDESVGQELLGLLGKIGDDIKTNKKAIEDEAWIRENQDNQFAQDLHSETGARINADSQLRGEMTSHASASPIDHPDGSITSDKLANGAVTSTKLAGSAVTEGAIASGAVSSIKLSSSVINDINGKLGQTEFYNL